MPSSIKFSTSTMHQNMQRFLLMDKSNPHALVIWNSIKRVHWNTKLLHNWNFSFSFILITLTTLFNLHHSQWYLPHPNSTIGLLYVSACIQGCMVLFFFWQLYGSLHMIRKHKALLVPSFTSTYDKDFGWFFCEVEATSLGNKGTFIAGHGFGLWKG